jgi:uncharacterized protein YecE (DUF72 family)
MTIHVGVAGWDYPDWNGPVYPRRSSRKFDRLAWIARFVDVVEINSTFYRPVAPRVAESWVRRTRDLAEFTFTAKAHRSWTHDRRLESDDATLAGLAPLREAGRLGGLLVQFPQSFHWDERARERLARLRERAADWPLVAEVRHGSWNDDEADRWLRARGIGWCAVDQPRAGGATLPLVPRVIGNVGYLRLHGRNVANWFREDAGRDARYDYLYSADELRALVEPIRGIASEAAHAFVVQNNHFRGQALVNALQLKQMLEGRAPAAPAELVAHYPEITDQVHVERRGLF